MEKTEIGVTLEGLKTVIGEKTEVNENLVNEIYDYVNRGNSEYTRNMYNTLDSTIYELTSIPKGSEKTFDYVPNVVKSLVSEKQNLLSEKENLAKQIESLRSNTGDKEAEIKIKSLTQDYKAQLQDLQTRLNEEKERAEKAEVQAKSIENRFVKQQEIDKVLTNVQFNSSLPKETINYIVENLQKEIHTEYDFVTDELGNKVVKKGGEYVKDSTLKMYTPEQLIKEKLEGLNILQTKIPQGAGTQPLKQVVSDTGSPINFKNRNEGINYINEVLKGQGVPAQTREHQDKFNEMFKELDLIKLPLQPN